MSQIILTGSNGFIGTNLVERFLHLLPSELGLKCHPDEFQILGSDLASSLSRTTAERFRNEARYQYVDHLELEQTLEKLENPPLAIVHNGACSSTTETNPEVFQRLNVNYSKMLWNYCTKHSVPFIYASSAAVYGSGTLGFSDKMEKCKDYKSLNLYGQSKLDFDLWAMAQDKTPPVWFGLRYFNVYGPMESHKGGQASMVYHGYRQAQKNGKIRLFQSNTDEYADGEQQRDFVFVGDVVQVTCDLLGLIFNKIYHESALSRNGCFLNVGTGVARTWNSLAHSVFQSLGQEMRVEYFPTPSNIINQYQNYTCADLETLRTVGVTHQFHSLEEGVKKSIEKYQQEQ